MKTLLFLSLVAMNAHADHFLVKMKQPDVSSNALSAQSVAATLNVSAVSNISNVEHLSGSWFKVETANQAGESTENSMMTLTLNEAVEYVQPDYKLHMFEDFKIKDKSLRNQYRKMFQLFGSNNLNTMAVDNPEIPAKDAVTTGPDSLYDHQWGMKDIGVDKVKTNKSSANIIVAVIDTGVDYTHEDLNPIMWQNTGESGSDSNGKDKATNGIDDDGNGYIDDVLGWDFASNDNKPFDLSMSMIEILLGGGNPGHGTHCAGNVGAATENNKGIRGVGDNVSIMALRFLTEKGQGETSGAIKAIMYAVDNGARVLSNSWGSEGDEGDDADNKALKDAILYAESKGVIFIAAAGNGHQGKGYDNDTDPKPGVPASYDMENIISVAALDSKDALGSFSNWGAKTVDIGAPGVAVYSTVPANHYNDKVVEFFGKTLATWDGTSMATPHVAGAAALYLSRHPEKTWQEVKDAIMTSSIPVSSLNGKSVSGGKLNLNGLMQ